MLPLRPCCLHAPERSCTPFDAINPFPDSSQKRFTFQLQVQVKQGMAMAEWYAVRENPQCYPFVSRKTRRCVDKSSYGNRDIFLMSSALENESQLILNNTSL